MQYDEQEKILDADREKLTQNRKNVKTIAEDESKIEIPPPDPIQSLNQGTLDDIIAEEKKKFHDEFLTKQIEFLDQQIESIEKSLECPVCLETSLPPIYQCQESHLICTRCRDKVSICPQCRLKYGNKKTRNRYAERDSDKMEKFIQEKTVLIKKLNQ